MNKLATLMLAAPVLALAACHDSSGTDREIAQLKLEIAQLRDAESPESPKAAPATDTRAENLQIQLDRVQGELAEANKKIADLQSRPAGTGGGLDEQAVLKLIADAEAARVAKVEADRKEAEEKRKEAETARMAEVERIAKEYGIEFDPKDPQGSIRKIMRDPAQMQKAMQAMRTEADKRRFANTGLDEAQIEQVKKIEGDTRQKVSQAWREARRNETPADQVEEQIKQINQQQETELKTVMTEDQYKKYMDNGGPAAGAIPGLGELIPGWGGRGGRE